VINDFLERYHLFLKHPQFLWLLLLLPLLAAWYFYRSNKRASVLRISTTEMLRNFPVPAKIKWRPLLQVFQLLALACIIIALARPQRTNVSESIDSNGIDIVLSIDISGSMLAEDFKPNRLEAAKKTASEFVRERSTDRIGVVIFSGESFTLCPVTIDHNVVQEQLDAIQSGMLQDGTAIGMGLATAVDKLRDAKGKSRVVILMTDGVNNTGLIDPQTALEIAKAFKVRVYTIGVGTEGEALYPIQTPYGIQKKLLPVQIDEPLLRNISKQTGGRYYRATDNKSLQHIYDEINQLEKTKVQVNAYKQYTETFFPFVFVAIALLMLELILRYTYFKSLP